MTIRRRIEAARRVMPATGWLRRIRAALVLAILALAAAGASAADLHDLQIVSVDENSPGKLTVTVRTSDNQPPTTAFQLLFPAATSSAPMLTASDVTPVPPDASGLATRVIVCVDRSGSMEKVVPLIKAALQKVFAVPRKDLDLQLMSFGTNISDLQALSDDAGQRAARIAGIRAERGADGKTLLYDAIVKAINRLREDPAVKSGRLLVISDGKDEGSSISLESLSGIAHDRGFRIDSIGYGKAAPQSSSSLKALSTATGGAFVLAETSDQLADAVSQDLGVAPLPAFNVQFVYPSSEGAAHTDKAQLRYAVAGAGAVTAPLNKAVSVPSPPAPTLQASAASGTNVASEASDDVVPQQPSFIDRLKNFWAAASDLMRIAICAAGVVLLALIAWLVMALRRPDGNIEESGPPESEPVPPRLVPTQIGPIFPAPAMGRPAALLVEIGGRHAGKPYAIETPLVRIGAEPDNDMFVDDEFMSRKHAAIRYEAGSLYLSDVGSTNGTFLNGVRLAQTPRLLAPGDEIRFGHTLFQLRGADHDTDDRRRRARTKVP